MLQLLFIYLFLSVYAIERTIFALKVSNRRKRIKKAWITTIPSLTYILIFFISVINFSKTSKILNFTISLSGISIFILGIYLRYQAIRAFSINKQEWSSHIDADHISVLIQSSPYDFIRHPYYLSVILELCGIALFLNSFSTIILIFLIQIPLLWKRIDIEETELIRKFGDRYLVYRKHVATIFPIRRKK